MDGTRTRGNLNAGFISGMVRGTSSISVMGPFLFFLSLSLLCSTLFSSSSSSSFLLSTTPPPLLKFSRCLRCSPGFSHLGFLHWFFFVYVGFFFLFFCFFAANNISTYQLWVVSLEFIKLVFVVLRTTFVCLFFISQLLCCLNSCASL